MGVSAGEASGTAATVNNKAKKKMWWRKRRSIYSHTKTFLYYVLPTLLDIRIDLLMLHLIQTTITKKEIFLLIYCTFINESCTVSLKISLDY